MRVLFMGQTGIDKQRHLRLLRELCSARGKAIDALFSIGDIMYEESQKAGQLIREGKILDLRLAELAVLRRAAFNRIGNESAGLQNVFVSSHAVFRWNNQLFRAFELADFEAFQPDLIITLVDDVEAVKLSLEGLRDSGELPADTAYSLKDLLVWREEEMLAAEILASILGVPHYVLGVWLEPEVTSTHWKWYIASCSSPGEERPISATPSAMPSPSRRYGKRCSSSDSWPAHTSAPLIP